MSRRTVRLAFAAALVLPGLGFVPGLASSSGQGLGFSCARKETPVVSTRPTAPDPPKASVASAAPKAESDAPPAAPAPPSPRDQLTAWLTARLPIGGAIVESSDGASIVHTTSKKGETLSSILTAYADVTTHQSDGEQSAALVKANPILKNGPLPIGTKVTITRVVQEAPKPPSETRLGWPTEEGGALKGIYVNSSMMASPSFPATLDKLAVRGMNAIVLDAKDVTGWVTYPSKIPFAVTIDASKHAVVSSYERLVRVAHARKIRVIARITCFRDEHVGPRRKDLAIQKKGGGPHVAPSKIIDWLDPSNEEFQNYILAIVDEVAAMGVDEVQLDYVRYPTEGIWDADFHLKERGLTTRKVITDFVARVHERTKAAGIPLSLDVFGVVAWRVPADMDATGQDLRMLAPHIDALSPMVYPSHFAEGFNGYAKPGDHADVVGIGTRRAVEEIKAAKATVAVRSWVQAFPWRTTNFGPQYVADQMASAKNAGGVGWLAWNSGGEYSATYVAVPVKKTTLASK